MIAAAAAVFLSQVMLVRKKNATDEGQVFAMKVLKKDVISAKGQVEHTKSERDILFEVRHPYIVRLRYAFQSDDKLYLVTDYYNGGTLFYHLRKSRQFTEERAKFYAAELLSALGHLHQQNIIYRDLKLENVLMDHQGHLALTDFGLSKQNIDATGGATTFCGTAEYIAPELLKGQKYGAAVDWWSFGILL
jgi:serine/threonine protein kinase